MPYNEHDMVAIGSMIEELFKEEVPQTINGWIIEPTYDIFDGDRGLMGVRITLTYKTFRKHDSISTAAGSTFMIEPEDPTIKHRFRDHIASMVRGVIHYTNDYYHANAEVSEPSLNIETEKNGEIEVEPVYLSVGIGDIPDIDKFLNPKSTRHHRMGLYWKDDRCGELMSVEKSEYVNGQMILGFYLMDEIDDGVKAVFNSPETYCDPSITYYIVVNPECNELRLMVYPKY